MLPRAAFGAQPMSDGLGPDAPDVVVLHHFMGSGRAGRRRWALGWLGAWLRPGGARAAGARLGAAGGGGGGAGLAGLAEAGGRGREGTDGGAEDGLARRAAAELYPVSVSWEPPFTMLVDLAGAGDVQARRVFFFFFLLIARARLAVSHGSRCASSGCQLCRRRSDWLARATRAGVASAQRSMAAVGAQTGAAGARAALRPGCPGTRRPAARRTAGAGAHGRARARLPRWVQRPYGVPARAGGRGCGGDAGGVGPLAGRAGARPRAQRRGRAGRLAGRAWRAAAGAPCRLLGCMQGGRPFVVGIYFIGDWLPQPAERGVLLCLCLCVSAALQCLCHSP